MSLGHVHLTPQFVQAVRDAVDIVSVAEEHTRLKRRGGRYLGLCPLHKEKTPSFTVDPQQNLFYCFGCSRGGDAIKLHQMLSGDDFPTAMEALAGRFGVPIPRRSEGERGRSEPDLDVALAAAAELFSRQLEQQEAARGYLRERGFSSEIAAEYGLGYAPDSWETLLRALTPKIPVKDLLAAGLVAESTRTPGKHYDRFRHRLVFPIHSPAGRLVGFGGRTLGDDRAKYINTEETPSFRKKSLLYGLHRAKRGLREGGRAVLAEGYFDVLGLAAAGVEGAVASMGTALTPDQAQLLARFAEEVVVAYDGDEAGWEAYRRALPMLLGLGLTVRRLLLGPGEDPDSVRQERGPEALARLVEEAPDAVEHELEALIPSRGSTSPQEQARLAAAATTLLAPVRDPVLRYAWGRRAADRLSLPFDLLAPTLGRRPREERATTATPEDHRRRERTPGRDLELAALSRLFALLESTGAAGAVPPADGLPPAEVFWDAEARNIWTAFAGLYREGGEPPAVAAIRARLEAEGRSVDLMARVLIEGADSPGTANSAGAEGLGRALARLHRRWSDQRLKELSREINEAQRVGDEERLQRLVEEKSRLSRRVHLGTE